METHKCVSGCSLARKSETTLHVGGVSDGICGAISILILDPIQMLSARDNLLMLKLPYVRVCGMRCDAGQV